MDKSCHLPMEIDCEDEFLHMCYAEDDKFLRDILCQPSFSSDSETDHSFHASSNSLVVDTSKRPRRSSSPRRYILSFDNSTMIPAAPEPCLQLLDTEGIPSSSNSILPSKRAPESPNPEPRTRPGQASKKARSSSQTTDHIMAERRRRQELTERFTALSATIPGLSKTDKASVLGGAIDYVKKLKERIDELEKEEAKKGLEWVMLMNKGDLSGNEESSSSESSCDYCSILPEMEARVLGNEVLVEIHCEKQNGIELNILDHLENLNLSVTGSSVLPFGNSALCITMIAKMGDAYNMTVHDLVKNIRQVLLKSRVTCDSDPY